MKSVLISLAVVLAGCSSGLQEVAFMDHGRYVVSRSLVNDRVTANQPHAQGVFLCRQKISSEEMAELRQDGDVHSAYMDCEPATQYTVTSDQSILTQASGPIEGLMIGAAVGTGLALSGDSVTQRGGSTSTRVDVTATQKQKNVTKKRR